jgi:hypothetical protein
MKSQNQRTAKFKEGVPVFGSIEFFTPPEPLIPRWFFWTAIALFIIGIAWVVLLVNP